MAGCTSWSDVDGFGAFCDTYNVINATASATIIIIL
jgi:hypothetical protein